jgi:glycosyltransferase involved in cell wall biosynthesis
MSINNIMVDEPLITIVTVNYKTSDFINLMLYAFKNLTKNKYKVIICDNYSSDKEVAKISKVTNNYNNVELILRRQTKVGSVGHAEALDLLISKVTTPYFVTMDSDATFLMKDWDELLINKLSNSIKLIGSSVPLSSKNSKAKDFPHAYSVMYETKAYKSLGVTFMPKDIKNPSQDTGWELKEKYLSSNYSGYVFETISTRDKINTAFNSIYCTVYYLDSKLIASHFGRGGSGGSPKYHSKLIYQIPLLSKYIRKYMGLRGKRNWIEMCYKIISEKKY